MQTNQATVYSIMKNNIFKGTSSLLLTVLLLVWPPFTSALEFDEIKEFGEVFEISAQATDRRQIEVNWKITDGYYLYNNKFLKFKSRNGRCDSG